MNPTDCSRCVAERHARQVRWAMYLTTIAALALVAAPACAWEFVLKARTTGDLPIDATVRALRWGFLLALVAGGVRSGLAVALDRLALRVSTPLPPPAANALATYREAGSLACSRHPFESAPGPTSSTEFVKKTATRASGWSVGLHFGVLAALALSVAPLGQRYTMGVKQSEATATIERIYRAEMRYFDWSSEHSVAEFVGARATPASVPTAISYPANPSAWRHDPGWSALGFSISGPHYYQYRVEATNPHSSGPLNGYNQPEPSFTVTAIGDLDGDGVLSTFSRVGYFFRGEFNRSQLVRVHELE